MDDPTNLIGVCMGLFVVCVLIASAMTRRALNSLDDPSRATLVRIASSSSFMNLAVPIVIAIAYTGVVIANRELLPLATVVALGALLAHGLVSAIITHRKYRDGAMPPEFLKYFKLARGVRILGAFVLFSGITLWLFISWKPRGDYPGEHDHVHEGSSQHEVDHPSPPPAP